MDTTSHAIVELGRALQRDGYTFVSVTPETQRRVVGRTLRIGSEPFECLRNVFGWNRPFRPESIARSMLDLMISADLITHEGTSMRSRVRFATLQGELFAHSGFPTTEAGSVFFGPDTYRFWSLLRRWTPRRAKHVVDIGAGTGAAGILLSKRAKHVVLADVNPHAVTFARVNAALASAQVDVIESDVMQAVEGQPDLIVANPPYLRDAAERLYRNGGGEHGESLSVRIVHEALARLSEEGTLILYTGTAVVDGVDMFMRKLLPVLEHHSVRTVGPGFSYEEIDPDVFGEELDEPAYADVDRIAAVGLRITKA